MNTKVNILTLPSRRRIPTRHLLQRYARVQTILIIVILIAVLTGCPAAAQEISPSAPPGMNFSVDPGDNFFEYANGNWIDEHPVPAGDRFYSAFEEVEETVDSRVRGLVEDASRDYGAEEGSPRQLLGSFYRAALNDESNERTGLRPLEDELLMIEGVMDRSGIRNVTSNLTAHGLDPFFILYIDENPEKRSELVATIDTGDFTLRFAPFYELEYDETTRVQEEMKRYVTAVFMDQGLSQAQAGNAAETVFRIERRLARGEMNLDIGPDSRSADLKPGTYQTDELETLFPGIDWEGLLAYSGRPDLQELYIMNPGYLQEVGRIISTEPVPDLKTFLTWRVLQFAAPFATPKMQDRYYRFYDVDLSKGEMTPQKDRIFDIMNLYLGNPIAHLYVDRYFSAEEKEEAMDIVEDIRDVMVQRVSNLSWMSPETKATALEKMDLLKEQVGYPEEWGQYQNLTIGDSSYLENMLELTDYFTNGSLQLSGEPSDPDVWYVSPHGVEAHYDLIHNRIITPAGFLNPPFFDATGDDAWNYGAFGWVYGHELIHMVDIGGQQYAPSGKKENWWNDADANRYFHAAWPLIMQVNSTPVTENQTLNGTQTLIETSADLGGLTLAYEAYIQSRPDPDTLDTPGIDGFSDRQRFFIAFAQALRGNITEESLVNVTNLEEHPWNSFRANTIPYHLDGLYEAFPDINQGDALYLNESERSRLW